MSRLALLAAAKRRAKASEEPLRTGLVPEHAAFLPGRDTITPGWP